ncbi:MAG: DUF5658 family protein [Candidatus Woesearchaeota archaeon]
MGLETLVKSICKHKEFLIASGTYIAASAADYLMTIEGIRQNLINEANPVIARYIQHLGTEEGIMIPKVAIGTCMLTLMWYVDRFNSENKTKIKSQYILYPAALLTALTGASWYIADQFADKF